MDKKPNTSSMVNNNYIALDNRLIYQEQKKVLRYLFEKIDLSKIVFVGGIADYLNLRDYYHMIINDVDLIYEEEKYLETFLKENQATKYKNKFYESLHDEVLVVNIPVGKKLVHFDLFRKDFEDVEITESILLGKKVLHKSFEAMRTFHNTEIGKQTSEVMQKKYEWKRLYKHSIKASLYNTVYHGTCKKSQDEMPIRYALTK
ncbi:conserved protein of unknown function [Tenacibaculum sp. 190524A02b]|uniref:hypothetical protein n=1 Tax=Tenacibaculum vairaonense TaxID=3137860 RepID=UPI0032B1323D